MISERKRWGVVGRVVQGVRKEEPPSIGRLDVQCSRTTLYEGTMMMPHPVRPTLL